MNFRYKKTYIITYFFFANKFQLAVQCFRKGTWGIVSGTCRCDAKHSFEEFNSGSIAATRAREMLASVIFSSLTFCHLSSPRSLRPLPVAPPRSTLECNFRARSKNPARCGIRHVRHRYNSFDETVEMPSVWLSNCGVGIATLFRAHFVSHLDRSVVRMFRKSVFESRRSTSSR